MSFSNASNSSLLFVSINTLQFVRDLKEFILTLISVGFILFLIGPYWCRVIGARSN